MASLSFSFRSKKPKAFLEVRLSYRLEGVTNPFSIYGHSDIEVKESYWKNDHKRKSNDRVLQKVQNALNTEMTSLRTFVLDRFDKTDIEHINKDWFLKVLYDYYNPQEQTQVEVIPSLLIDYIPYYLKSKSKGMTEASVRKYKVVQNRLIDLESSLGKRYEIKDINDNFQNEFEQFYEDRKYSQNTMQRALVFVKTICKHARTKGIETHPEMDGLKLSTDTEVPKIWLTFKDLEQIENTENLPDYLDNARDWLIISAYTAQRVSDLLRFNSEMIREKQGNKLLEFRQQKTKTVMTVPLHRKVLAILEKRNGEFPRSISDQRYNEYIKEVCQKAELNQPTKGRLKKNISKVKNVTKMRIVEGVYPKWQLVSSHIGRRSFASNFYGTIPTTHIMNTTGHTTEGQLLEYIGKSKEELALETFKYF